MQVIPFFFVEIEKHELLGLLIQLYALRIYTKRKILNNLESKFVRIVFYFDIALISRTVVDFF